MTSLVDVVVDADGALARGQVTVYWPMFMSGSNAVSQGQKTYPIEDGLLNIDLFPTVTALPSGSYYTATFQLSNGSVYDEYWIVPESDTAVKLNQIRAMFPPEPGLFINANQITGTGASLGQFLGWNGFQWTPMAPGMVPVSVDDVGKILARLEAIESRLTAGGL
jgi:hypothetical protein